jgi:hypothetical protein
VKRVVQVLLVKHFGSWLSHCIYHIILPVIGVTQRATAMHFRTCTSNVYRQSFCFASAPCECVFIIIEPILLSRILLEQPQHGLSLICPCHLGSPVTSHFPSHRFFISQFCHLNRLVCTAFQHGLWQGACSPSFSKYPRPSTGYHPRMIVVAAIHGALPDPLHGTRHVLPFVLRFLRP